MSKPMTTPRHPKPWKRELLSQRESMGETALTTRPPECWVKPPKVYGEGSSVDFDQPNAQAACELLHVPGLEQAYSVANQLIAVARPSNPPLAPTEAINEGLAAIQGLGPQSRREAMLATQMHGTHNAQIEFTRRTLTSKTADVAARNATIATRFGVLWCKQAELLLKMQGHTGRQTITVQHQHVHMEPGAQAVIGNIEAGGGGGER